MPFKPMDAPEAFDRDDDALEILRMAVGGSGSSVALSDVFQNPRQWGFVLADIANHVVNLYEQQGWANKNDALRAIEDGYSVRMEKVHKISGRILPTSN